MNTVIFPVLHGVQFKELPDSFADDFINGIKSYLPEEERDFLIPVPYNWSGKTLPKQMEIFQRVESGLNNMKLRRIKHTVGADVVWYNRTKSDIGFFNTIHKELNELIGSKLSRHQDAKIAIFGHSLGSQVAFNYCWETELQEISGIFIAGSPLTMYSGMYSDWGKIPPNMKGFLINFYNKTDFISSRIDGVHPSKEIADRTRDIEVPIGWNPLNWFTLNSHEIYWGSRTVWKTTADYLSKLIRS